MSGSAKSPETTQPWAPCRILELPEGSDPYAFAFEHGIRTAATASKPLSRAERRTAVLRLLVERPEASDREIGRLVGVSHQTVGRLRKWSTDQAGEPGDADVGDDYFAFVSADELAARLARSLARLWEQRALSDSLLGDKTGRRLARALVSLHGDEEARQWARRLQSWANTAVTELDPDKG